MCPRHSHIANSRSTAASNRADGATVLPHVGAQALADSIGYVLDLQISHVMTVEHDTGMTLIRIGTKCIVQFALMVH